MFLQFELTIYVSFRELNFCPIRMTHKHMVLETACIPGIESLNSTKRRCFRLIRIVTLVRFIHVRPVHYYLLQLLSMIIKW